jgi:hypothetical protein
MQWKNISIYRLDLRYIYHYSSETSHSRVVIMDRTICAVSNNRRIKTTAMSAMSSVQYIRTLYQIAVSKRRNRRIKTTAMSSVQSAGRCRFSVDAIENGLDLFNYGTDGICLRAWEQAMS